MSRKEEMRQAYKDSNGNIWLSDLPIACMIKFHLTSAAPISYTFFIVSGNTDS